MPILIFLVAITAIVFFTISYFQVASFFINYFGSGAANDFWSTGNFWAWVFMLVIMAFVVFLLKLAAVIINRIIIWLLGVNRKGYWLSDAQAYGIIALAVIWGIFSIVAGLSLFNYFASFRGYTDWFVEGNWIAPILLMISIFAIVNRFKVSDKD